MEKFDRSIQDFFTGEYSHRGAELGSAIPLIGTILGGVLGSVIDGVSWVFKSEDQGGGGGIVKSYGKITDMVNDQIVNLFSFGTYAKMGAELGRDSPYFSMAAALFGGLIGSIADAAAFLFGEKALDSLRDISLSSIDKGIVSVFSSYDSLAGEWASYGLNGVPLLSPIIYGLMGVLGAFFKGFIDDEFFAKVERLWYTAKAKFWSLIGFDDNSKENQAEVDKLDKRITEIQVEKDKQYQARKAQREAQRKAEDEQRAKDRAERDKKHAEDIARRNATRQVKHGANPPPEVQTITQQQLAEKHIVSVELDSGKAISEIDAKLKDVEKVSLRYDDGKVEESTVGKLRDMFKSFSENVVAGVSEAAEKGKEIYGKLKDKAAEATEDLPQFTSDAREAMSSFGDSVVEGTKWLGNSIFTGFKSLSTMFISMVEKMSGWFEQNAPDYYKESIQPMLASAKESVTDMNFGEMANKAYEATKKFTKETALPALESGADKVGELASRAADKAKEGYEAAKPIVSKAAETTAAVAKDVVHDVADVGSRAYEGAKGLAKSAKSLFSSQDDFVKKMYPAAKAVGTPVGIAPEIILAQAGLESGWGKSLPVNEDGTSSFNFFGIKAGPHWTGKRSARTGTHEFTGGSMHGEKATFRSYDSPEEGFKGYISFLQNNQRYSNAFQHGNDAQAYFTALKQDGYATDPNYVSKTVGTYNKVVKIVGGKSNVDPHQEDQSKVNTSAQTGPKPSLVSRAASAVAGGAMSFATHGLAYLADLEKRTNERLASEGKAPIKTVFGDMLTRTNEMQNDNGPPDSTEKPSQDNSNQEQTVEVKPAGSLKGFETGYPNQIPFTHNASDRVHLNRIHPEVYNRLVGMAKEYHDITGHSLTIKSAYRTPEEQARSIKSARPGYAARQGKSMHQWGYALDINTDHVNALASTASKKTGKPLLETYGFRRPMMTQKLYEPWHIEPIEIAQDRFKIPDGLVPKLSSYGKFVEESKIEQKKENNKEIPSVTANTGITPPPNLDKVDNTPVSKDQIQEDEAEGDVAPEGAKIETPTTSQPAAPVQSSAPAVQQEVAKSEEKKMEESTESPVKVPEIASPKSAVQEAVKTKETGMYSDFDKNAKPKTPEELKVLVEKAQSKTGTASSAPAIQQEVAKPIETTTIPKSTETGTASSAPAVQQAIKGFDYSDMSRGHMRVPVGTGYLTMTKEEYDQRLKDPNFTTTENPWKTASYQLKQGTWSNEAATSHASDIKGQQDLYAKITGTTSSAPAVQQLAAGTGTASSAPAVQQEVSKPKYELTASEQAAKNTQSGLYNFVRNIFKSDEDKLKEYRNERNRIETERGIADSSLNPDGSIKLEKTTKSQVAGVTSPPISDDEVKSKLEAQNKEMDAVNAELETAQANYKTKSADIESQYKSGKITKEEHDSKISNLKEGLKTVLAKVDETEKRWDKESASWNNSAYKEATKTKDKDIQLQVDNETGTTSSAPAVQQEVSKSTTSEQTANIGASPDVNSYLRETERYYKDSDAFESGIKSAREGFKARSAEIDTALKEGKITQDQANAQRKEAEDAKTKAIDKLDGSSFQQRRNDLLAQAKGLSSSSPEVQKMIVSSSSYFKDINTVQDEKNKINDIRKQYQSGKLSKKDALSKLNTFDPAILKRENNEDEDQKARDQYTERRKEIETQITGLTTQVPTPSQSKEPQNAEPQIEKPGIFQTLGNTVKSIFSPRQSQTPSLTTDLRQYIGANKHFNVNELSAQLAYKNAGMISPDKFNPFSAIKNAFTPNVAQPISRTDNSIFHKTETENLEDKSKSETKIETDKSISKSNENANLDTSNSTISNSQNTSINPINISHSNNVTTSPSSMETVKYDPELDNIINTLFAAIPDAFKSNTVQFSTGFGI
jgi:flagellar rod assembly protein/muramidase FlgJ